MKFMIQLETMMRCVVDNKENIYFLCLNSETGKTKFILPFSISLNRILIILCNLFVVIMFSAVYVCS